MIGSGGVHFVDGGGITPSNIAQAGAGRASSIRDPRLHLLRHGIRFDLNGHGGDSTFGRSGGR
nr:hypothetical protein [Roseomonas sp. SXEYE001]